MSYSSFRRFLLPHDDPRLSCMRCLTPYELPGFVCEDPAAKEVVDGWLKLFTETSFKGITTNGDPILDLWTPGQDEGAPRAEAAAAARNFLDGLSAADRARATHSLNSKVWRAWLNPELYLTPFGLRLEEMTRTDVQHAMDLLRASLSEWGYKKVLTLMRINEFLGQLVDLPKIMNSLSYNINIFGVPGGSEPWGFNFYGHHVCLNTIFIGNQQFFTPVFFGAEPNVIDEGEDAGTVIFKTEERDAAALARSLPLDLLREATLFPKKRDSGMPPDRIHPGDELHLGGAFQDNRIIPYEGVNVSNFPEKYLESLLRIVESFLAYQPDGPRRARMTEIREHLHDTYFCWIGGISDDDVFYYRIQSPVIMVEFDHHAGVWLGNPEPERFHIHTLVRTPNGNDYGVALLGKLGFGSSLDGPT